MGTSKMTLKKVVAGPDGPQLVDMSSDEAAAWQAESDANDPVAHPPDYATIDQAALNAALAAPGSVVRAIALIMLQEINTLRTKAGLATYTQQQLVTALQAKMR